MDSCVGDPVGVRALVLGAVGLCLCSSGRMTRGSQLLEQRSVRRMQVRVVHCVDIDAEMQNTRDIHNSDEIVQPGQEHG